MSVSEIVIGGVVLGHICQKCNGSGGEYETEINLETGKRDFKYGGWRGQDPQFKGCRYCKNGIIDTQEGELFRKWLNNY